MSVVACNEILNSVYDSAAMTLTRMLKLRSNDTQFSDIKIITAKYTAVNAMAPAAKHHWKRWQISQALS